MFNSITGIVTAKNPKLLYLENNGIEWEINVPDSNLEMIGSVGSEAKIYTWLLHTDVLMSLYGFASVQERSVFLDLLKVDGVGPKGALKIMSSVSSSRLMEVLEKGDLEMLEKIPGIGKKTAGKMMLALKGKIKISESDGNKTSGFSNGFSDVINSLAAMGYDKKIVEQQVSLLLEELQSSPGFSEKSQKEKEDIIFRRAIVGLS